MTYVISLCLIIHLYKQHRSGYNFKKIALVDGGVAGPGTTPVAPNSGCYSHIILSLFNGKG